MQNRSEYHSITVLSMACGVSTPTLRVWEKRYQAFTPIRGEAGQRLYSESDLQRSKLIAILLEKGHAISSVAKYSLGELKNLIENEFNDIYLLKEKFDIQTILKLLEKYELNELINELQFQRQSLGARDFLFKVVLPVMQKIGLMVAKEKLTIGQEHIVSSVIRDQLSKIVLPSCGENIEKIAIATPEGNLHELAILIADIVCKINRVPTYYLGAAHPAHCLGEAVTALKCQYIIMGVISSDHWSFQENIIKYLSSLDKSLDTEVKVLLGGGWKIDLPEFRKISEVIFFNNFEEFDEYLFKNFRQGKI